MAWHGAGGRIGTVLDRYASLGCVGLWRVAGVALAGPLGHTRTAGARPVAGDARAGCGRRTQVRRPPGRGSEGLPRATPLARRSVTLTRPVGICRHRSAADCDRTTVSPTALAAISRTNSPNEAGLRAPLAFGGPSARRIGRSRRISGQPPSRMARSSPAHCPTIWEPARFGLGHCPPFTSEPSRCPIPVDGHGQATPRRRRR